jgi:hypothetical protein
MTDDIAVVPSCYFSGLSPSARRQNNRHIAGKVVAALYFVSIRKSKARFFGGMPWASHLGIGLKLCRQKQPMWVLSSDTQ